LDCWLLTHGSYGGGARARRHYPFSCFSRACFFVSIFCILGHSELGEDPHGSSPLLSLCSFPQNCNPFFLQILPFSQIGVQPNLDLLIYRVTFLFLIASPQGGTIKNKNDALDEPMVKLLNLGLVQIELIYVTELKCILNIFLVLEYSCKCPKADTFGLCLDYELFPPFRIMLLVSDYLIDELTSDNVR
jgi:hypothetical protein